MNKIIVLLLLILLSPIIIIISIIIKLDSSGEIIFKQKRFGKNSELFDIWKFRTFKDGKVTRAGRLIRKFKLDEIAQLINILKGEMNFVGPRPVEEDEFNARIDQLSNELTSL